MGKESNDGGPYSDKDLNGGGSSKNSGDGSPSTQDPEKWSGNGRGAGSQDSDGGPYEGGDLGFSKD